ncbi:MAG: MFS transporter [Desulfitobacteriia bacterium]|jgi:GPH family glycoside/pentoside/hexuronide:cation symporter
MNDIKVKTLSVGKKFGYSIGAFGDSVGFNVFYFFFLFFLTDIAGIPPAFAGTIALIAIAWDAVTDPIVGHISDNLKSKHGRRRPMMIAVAIPYALCMFLLFNNIDLSVNAKIVYFTAIAILFWSTYKVYVIPYFALGAEMTQDFNERTSLRLWASVAMQLSVMLASAAPLMIVEKSTQMGFDLSGGWRNVAIIFGVVIALAILICWRMTKGSELPPDKIKAVIEDKKNIFRTILEILKLKPSLPLAGSIFCWSLVTAMASSGPVFLMTNNLGFEASTQSTFFVINTLIAIAWLPVVGFLSKNLGKKKAYIITMGVGGLCMMLFGVAGITGFVTIIIWTALFQFGNSSFWTLYYSMMYDISEVDEFVNGRRREGIVTAIMAFCQKLGAAVGTWLSGMVLAWGAYDGLAAVQAESALKAILYNCTLIPGAFGVLAAVCALFYPLTGQRFNALSNALEARRAGKEFSTEGFQSLL